ncbi:MAG: M4 family metallopeptidase [Bacteroidota bacterium]
MKSIITSLFLCCSMFLLSGQGMKQIQRPTKGNTNGNSRASSFQPAINLAEKAAHSKRLQQAPRLKYAPMPKANFTKHQTSTFQILQRTKSGLPTFIQGKLEQEDLSKSMEARAYDYLKALQDQLPIREVQKEFKIHRQERDELGQTHIRMLQEYEGLEVYGGEVILHTDATGKMNLFNGRYSPSPKLKNLMPTLGKDAAFAIAESDLAKRTYFQELSKENKKYTSGNSAKLLIFHKDLQPNQAHLAWHLVVVPNLLDRWEYFIDAHSGEILLQMNTSCSFYGHVHGKNHKTHQGVCVEELPKADLELPSNGPVVARGTDLFGEVRQFGAYEENGQFFMVDASQPMFNEEQFRNGDLVGVLATIDAKNTQPGDNFNASLATSSNKDNWNDPKAVSAHYNSTLCYNYYRQKFNRNSINGSGGNIRAFFNVTENGAQMDNAFWNGEAIFYGNGDVAFNAPLQKALDVAGHEMTHGVVQETAGLIYLGQSGALNESFSDVFGVLIENETYQLAEDVADTRVFRSGAMRDMANPNNGGNRFGDNGWQPATMSQYVNLSNDQDNGGVHVNSGVPNFAFFKIATAIGVEKAEQIYYRALSQYLTRSSQFIDARLALVQAAADRHGASSSEVAAVKRAFDEVGIFDGEETETEVDLEQNEGADFIVMTDADFSPIYLFDGESVPAISNTKIASRPSVTDDGRFIVFVADDGTLRIMVLNEQGTYTESFLENNPQNIWRNVVVSKDGTKIAATTNDLRNEIFVFDFNSGLGQTFELFNPTTAQGGFDTDGVRYSDFMEWDYQGEFLMYDSYNVLGTDDLGLDVDYWDIAFIQVWDSNGEQFANGDVFKLITSLPENVSIGNPTFSKNSPYIIAFDWFYDDGITQEYQIVGANIERGELRVITENSDLGYPNFSPKDEAIIYDSPDFFGDEFLDIIALGEDKISSVGSSQTLIEGGKWGVWFVQGERDLVISNTEELVQEDLALTISPNPFDQDLQLSWNSKKTGTWTLEVFDALGRKIQELQFKSTAGKNQQILSTGNWKSGNYILRLGNEEQVKSLKVTKI